MSGWIPTAPPDLRARWAAVIDAVRSVPALAALDVIDVTHLDGMSNTTCLVRVDDRRVVVRIPAGGDDPVVDRVVELANTKAAAAEGLGPNLVYADPARQLLVTQYVDGAPLTRATVRRGTMIEQVARVLARLHALDASRFRGRFVVGTVLERYRRRLARAGDRLNGDDIALLRRAQRVCATLGRTAAVVPCHNDPWHSNIINAGDRLVLVDWEYSGIGDAVWDLAHFAVEADLDPDETERLLYAWSGGPPPPLLRARLALWRPVTDVVWGLWARVQHNGGNDCVDLSAYAGRRLRRARRALVDVVTLADRVHL